MSFSSYILEELDIPSNLKKAALRGRTDPWLTALFADVDKSSTTKANLTVASILLTPLPRLAETLRCKIPFAQDLVKAVSRATVPEIKRADELYHAEFGYQDGEESWQERGRGKWISMGDEGLDECLGGGLRRGCLYEITGESSAGKSHFILHLAICTQLSSLTASPGSCLILNSEHEVSTERLVQLARPILEKHDSISTDNSGIELDSRLKMLTDNVLARRVSDIDALEHALSQPVPALLEARNRPSQLSAFRQAKPIRLLVIDSITALLRGNDPEVGANSGSTASLTLIQRSKHLCTITDLLKSLAVTYDMAVVVINQVSDVFSYSIRSSSPVYATPPSSALNQTQPFGPEMSTRDGEEPPMLYARQARWFNGQSNVLNKKASLGIVWANAVNVRIMLSRTARRRLLYQSDLRPAKRRHADEDPVQDEQARLETKVNDAQPTLIRRMHVVFSPFAPSGTVDYAITPSGIHSLADSYQRIDILENVRKQRASLARQGGQLLRPGTMGVEWEAGKGEEDEDEVHDEYGDLPDEFWQQAMAEDIGMIDEDVVAAARGDNEDILLESTEG
nr:hypothetical protein L204_00742 [Cryptococcus depauperatus CBS 7855]